MAHMAVERNKVFEFKKAVRKEIITACALLENEVNDVISSGSYSLPESRLQPQQLLPQQPLPQPENGKISSIQVQSQQIVTEPSQSLTSMDTNGSVISDYRDTKSDLKVGQYSNPTVSQVYNQELNFAATQQSMAKSSQDQTTIIADRNSQVAVPVNNFTVQPSNLATSRLLQSIPIQLQQQRQMIPLNSSESSKPAYQLQQYPQFPQQQQSYQPAIHQAVNNQGISQSQTHSISEKAQTQPIPQFYHSNSGILQTLPNSQQQIQKFVIPNNSPLNSSRQQQYIPIMHQQLPQQHIRPGSGNIPKTNLNTQKSNYNSKSSTVPLNAVIPESQSNIMMANTNISPRYIQQQSLPLNVSASVQNQRNTQALNSIYVDMNGRPIAQSDRAAVDSRINLVNSMAVNNNFPMNYNTSNVHGGNVTNALNTSHSNSNGLVVNDLGRPNTMANNRSNNIMSNNNLVNSISSNSLNQGLPHQMSSLKSLPPNNSSTNNFNPVVNNSSNNNVITTVSTPTKRQSKSSISKEKERLSLQSSQQQLQRQLQLDRDKMYIERENEILLNLNRRRDQITAKLIDIERQNLVGMKGPCAAVTNTIRPKTHWDFLMDEVQWMAIDFRQELRWKLTAAQAVAEQCANTRKCRVSVLPKDENSTDYAQDETIRHLAKKLSYIVSTFWSDFSLKSKQPSLNSTTRCTSTSSTMSSASLTYSTAPIIHNLGNKLDIQGNQYFKSSNASSMNISLLDYQRFALNKILGLNEAGRGCIVKGNRCVGKTALLVVACDHWLANVKGIAIKQESTLCQGHEDANTAFQFPEVENTATDKITDSNNNSSKSKSILVFTSRRTVIRWVSELERILPNRSVQLWLPSTAVSELNDSVLDFSVESSSLPTSDIVICVLELASYYVSQFKLKCEMLENIIGVVIDIRGVAEWPNIALVSEKNDVKYNLPVEQHWLYILSTLLISVKPSNDCSAKNYLNHCVVVEESISILQLSFLNPFLDPSKVDKIDIKNDCLYTRVEDLIIEVTVSNAVESYGAAQVREDVLAHDMDSLQHLKYFQVMDCLLSQYAFLGENPWILAQALVLLRRVCFHESFVTIGRKKNTINSQKIDSKASSTLHDSSDTKYCTGIGLGFGLSQPSFMSGLSLDYSRKFQVLPTQEGFLELLDFPQNLLSLKSKNVNYTTTNGNTIETNVDMCSDKSIFKYMLQSSLNDNLNFKSTGLPTTNSESQYPLNGKLLNEEHQTGFYPPRSMNTCFSPGPLCSKLMSPARFNMNGNFYDSIGSCKLQVLRSVISRFSGLRTVIVVSTTDEQLTVHNFLNRVGYEHTCAGIVSSRDNSNYNESGNFSSMQTVSWLSAQSAVHKFNRTALNASSPALMIVNKEVFLQPGLLPWKADVVIILSDDWISPTDIKNCFRLRLASDGPSGDPVTVVRVVAKGTLEEVATRRGGLLNLQHISLIDIFPTYAHTLQIAYASAIAVSHRSVNSSSNQKLQNSINSMLSAAPSCNIARKLKDGVFETYKTKPESKLTLADASLTLDQSNKVDSNDAKDIANCIQWLKLLNNGMYLAEFQFSKIGKYVPLSLLPYNMIKEFKSEHRKMYNDCTIGNNMEDIFDHEDDENPIVKLYEKEIDSLNKRIEIKSELSLPMLPKKKDKIPITIDHPTSDIQDIKHIENPCIQSDCYSSLSERVSDFILQRLVNPAINQHETFHRSSMSTISTSSTTAVPGFVGPGQLVSKLNQGLGNLISTKPPLATSPNTPQQDTVCNTNQESKLANLNPNPSLSSHLKSNSILAKKIKLTQQSNIASLSTLSGQSQPQSGLQVSSQQSLKNHSHTAANLRSNTANLSNSSSSSSVGSVMHNQPSNTGNNSAARNVREICVPAILIRLVDSYARVVATNIIGKSENLAIPVNCMDSPNLKLDRFSAIGLGKNAMSNSEQLINKLYQPITTNPIPTPALNNYLITGSAEANQIISHLPSQNQAAGFRPSQLFRQTLTQNRMLGIPMDPHLHILTQLQTASQFDCVLNQDRNCGIHDVTLNITAYTDNRINSATICDNVPSIEKVTTTDSIVALSNKRLNLKNDKLQQYGEKSHVLDMLLRIDLTNSSKRLKIDADNKIIRDTFKKQNQSSELKSRQKLK